MTESFIDRLERLTAEATPELWLVVEDSSDGMDEAWCEWHTVGPLAFTGRDLNKDTAFVAAAQPQTVRALLAFVRAAPEALEMLERAGDWIPRGGTSEAIAGAVLRLRAALDGIKQLDGKNG